MTATSSPAEPSESTQAALERAAEKYADGSICYRATTPRAHHHTVKQAFIAGTTAAILAATPTAAHVEADGVALLAPWPCCEHCADDSLHDESLHNNHDLPCQACLLDRLAIKPLAARVAELEAALAAAEARLRAVEALIGGPKPLLFLSDRPNKIVRVQQRDDRLGATVTRSMVDADDIRAALTPPQPAEEPFGWTVKAGAEFVGPCGHVIRVTDDRMVLAALVAKAGQHAASCRTAPTP